MIREVVLAAGSALALALTGFALGASPVEAEAQALPAHVLIRVQAGRLAPELTFLDEQERAHRLSEFRGKVVLVNLWATWCIPCRTEMPALERLAQAYPDDVRVVAISQDRQGWKAIDRFWGEEFSHAQVYRSADERLARHYGALGFPYTILLGRDGREIGRLPRAGEWDEGALRRAVDKAVMAS